MPAAVQQNTAGMLTHTPHADCVLLLVQTLAAFAVLWRQLL
jgi:hypothetical protein